MYESAAMCVVEARADFCCDANCIVDSESFLAVEPVTQRAAGNIRGDVVEKPFRLTRIDEWNDVRVREPRSDPDLAKEPLSSDLNADIFAQNLDCDFALVLALFSEMHDGHSAASKDALDLVSVFQCRKRFYHFGMING